MAYDIKLTPDAALDLRSFRAFDQQQVRKQLPLHLAHDPAALSNKRKPLSANPYGATWELRLGDVRVMYAIDEPSQTVQVLRFGRKVRERLYLRGVPVEMRLG